MSRRKQARPIRHLDSEGPAEVAIANGSENEKEDGDQRRHNEDAHNTEGMFSGSEIDDSVASPTGSLESREGEEDRRIGRRSPLVRLHNEETKLGDLQNSLINSLGSLLNISGSQSAPPGLFSTLKSNAPTPESVQNTSMAVAQMMAAAIANNSNNPKALQELAMLQPSLYALQRQQMFQLNLIQQLQSQMTVARPTEAAETEVAEQDLRQVQEEERSPTVSPIPAPQMIPTSPERSPPRMITDAKSPAAYSVPLISELPGNQPLTSSLKSPSSSPLRTSSPVTTSLASSVIQPNDDMTTSVGNSLAMLQKTTQQVLNNASQGLLANNLVDDLYQRGKPSNLSDRKEEAFFKHRCRYCGKVFGSDSALQIHIRSHTGERPYKCNICGNRFTTKGNLKVHFQRHRDRFPHVKMNPNMVPEHLDKYYPPLLAQLGELPDTPQPPVPPPHFGSPLLGPPALYSRALNDDVATGVSESLPKLTPIKESKTPTTVALPQEAISLVKPKTDAIQPDKMALDFRQPEMDMLPKFVPLQLKRPLSDVVFREEAKKICAPKVYPEDQANEEQETNGFLKQEPDVEEEIRHSDSVGEERSLDSKISDKRDSGKSDCEEQGQGPCSPVPSPSPDLPQNLSKSATPNPLRIPRSFQPFGPSFSQRMPPTFSFNFPVTSMPHTPFPFPGAFNPLIGLPPGVDPCKDPVLYTNLLPKPGINDNSWEALIEVEKTSETSKLQQLVDNIENKITDPNQCVICQRVLSCKSALQMHYRTHTGERPFKCRICGRAFTTKGNLKTHMGVHRSKPPVRMTHQCPVCHKRFQNGLILQQHIRLHTGEPTDMSPEQIAAGEILEPPMPFPLPNMFPGGFPLPPSHLSAFPPFPGFPLPLHRRSASPDDGVDAAGVGDEGDVRSGDDGGDTNNIREGSEMMEIGRMQETFKRSGSMNGDRSDGSLEESMCSPVEDGYAGSPAVSEHPTDLARRSAEVDAVPPTCYSPRASPHMPLDLTPRTAAVSSSPISSSTATAPLLRLPMGLRPPMLPASMFAGGPFSFESRFPGLSFPALRGNTTCNICFKVFACQSALDIHYRSHTKERPFKCTECDKAFSTKGNMKQHMMTHRQKSDHLSPSPPPSESQPETPDHHMTVLSHLSHLPTGLLRFQSATDDRHQVSPAEGLDMTSHHLTSKSMLPGLPHPGLLCDVIPPYSAPTAMTVSEAL